MALFNWLEDAERRAKERQLAKTRRIEDYANRDTPLLDATFGTNRPTPATDIANARLDYRLTQGIGQPDPRDEERTSGGAKYDYDPGTILDTGVPDIVDPPIIPEGPNDCAAKGMVWNPIEQRCVEDPLNPDDNEYDPIINLDEPVVDDTPTSLYDMDQVTSYLKGFLTADASEDTEQKYWDTKMRRLDEQFAKAKKQKMEDMNVKGLYYSGARDVAMEELEEEYFQVVAEEEAKFQYERFDREVQRAGMAMQYSLGAKAQEIQWSLGRGQLTLQQLDLALQETLGIRALDLQEQGLLMDYMKSMYSLAISQETNDIARQQIWLNTISLLQQMGMSDEELNNFYLSLTGQPTAPAV